MPKSFCSATRPSGIFIWEGLSRGSPPASAVSSGNVYQYNDRNIHSSAIVDPQYIPYLSSESFTPFNNLDKAPFDQDALLPAGILQRKEGSGMGADAATMEMTLCSDVDDQSQAQLIASRCKHAAMCWRERGHRGWEIYPVESSDFMWGIRQGQVRAILRVFCPP